MILQTKILGTLEGISLLLLIFIATPIKYYTGDNRPVSLLGPIHGALYILFALSILQFSLKQNWGLKKTLQVVLFCLLPFGAFIIIKKMELNDD